MSPLSWTRYNARPLRQSGGGLSLGGFSFLLYIFFS
nr:MAG TPA: hypothetical protein [Caudoviricetes sp.]